MATSNRDRVGRALELLAQGLGPFVERELKAEFGAKTEQVVTYTLTGSGGLAPKGPFTDVQNLLKLMWDQWNAVFRTKLSQNERTLVSELRDTRNRWAHQDAFSTDDTDRALDSIKR